MSDKLQAQEAEFIRLLSQVPKSKMAEVLADLVEIAANNTAKGVNHE